MNAFEPLFWLLCAWIVVRIVKGASPKLWLVFGLVAGIGLENKHSMLVFGFALAVGLLLSGEYRLFRSKWIWLGAAVALCLFLPNLIWEARHGWPQIEVVRNAQRFKNEAISPLRFLFEQILFLHPLELPVWLGGLVWYFGSREGKRFRFLGWAYLIVLAIFIVFNGKTYYPLPVYPLLMAAGGVAFEAFVAQPRRRWLAISYPALVVVARPRNSSVWRSAASRQHVPALFERASFFSRKDRARRPRASSAALRRYVWLGRYGGDDFGRLSQPAGV